MEDESTRETETYKKFITLGALFATGTARIFPDLSATKLAVVMRVDVAVVAEVVVEVDAEFATDSTGVVLSLAPEPFEEDSVVNAIFAIAAW